MEAREIFVSLLHIIGIAMIFFMIDFDRDRKFFSTKNKYFIINLLAIIVAISIIRVK